MTLRMVNRARRRAADGRTLVLGILLAALATHAAAGEPVVAEMAVPRIDHTATLLASGNVLVAGGLNDAGFPATAEVCDPSSGAWTAAGSLATPRFLHTATRLKNGKVLVAGGWNQGVLASAELYDPASNAWTPTGSMAQPRYVHTATLLPDGRVLVVGGNAPGGATSSVEIYDPATGNWAAGPPLAQARYGHSATTMAFDRVLVAGGEVGAGTLASVEIYDPASNAWTAAARLPSSRTRHVATLLPGGKVLVVGGAATIYIAISSGLGPAGPPVIYDPIADAWAPAADPELPIPTATVAGDRLLAVLPTGKVVRIFDSVLDASSEMYDPAGNGWAAIAGLAAGRAGFTATLLPSGKVLIAGGRQHGNVVRTTELYEPQQPPPTIGFWDDPDEIGSGYTIDLHHGVLVLITYSYGPGGEPQWYISSGPLTNNGQTFSGALQRFRGGQCISCAYAYPVADGSDGTVTIRFSSPTQATVALPGGRVSNIRRTQFATDGPTRMRAPMVTARNQHAATLLSSGKVLVTGGLGESGFPEATEVYDPAVDTWTAAGRLTWSRVDHTATLLPNGMVLVAGGSNGTIHASAELYDPAVNRWTPTGSMTLPRVHHSATLLPNGKVLVVGGDTPYGVTATAEVYDFETGAWTAVPGLTTARLTHTATAIASGRVLVAGGVDGTRVLATVEIYDSETNRWLSAASLPEPRTRHLATLLADGRVLVAGGAAGNYDFAPYAAKPAASPLLYDATANVWTAAPGTTRHAPTSTPSMERLLSTLPSGRVLSIFEPLEQPACCDLYDPASNEWAHAVDLAVRRTQFAATLLPSGKVLVTGGLPKQGTKRGLVELYDPQEAPNVPVSGLWENPGEIGNGYAIDVQHGVLVLVTYSYTAAGAAQWYISSGRLTNNGYVFVGYLERYRAGQCISCNYVAPVADGNDGPVTIEFASPTEALLSLPGGRTVEIRPSLF